MNTANKTLTDFLKLHDGLLFMFIDILKNDRLYVRKDGINGHIIHI